MANGGLGYAEQLGLLDKITHYSGGFNRPYGAVGCHRRAPLEVVGRCAAGLRIRLQHLVAGARWWPPRWPGLLNLERGAAQAPAKGRRSPETDSALPASRWCRPTAISCRCGSAIRTATNTSAVLLGKA
ncbi:hypothetical protein M8494_15640 [Serratia ureilytica]